MSEGRRRLMPGSAGAFVSGTATRPITFSSYGRGQARITRGIFFATSRRYRDGPSHLTFTNLALGPRAGVEGTGNWITLSGLRIGDLMDPGTEVGIETMGSHWRIVGNTIDGTGDSGMLLGFGSSSPGVTAGGVDYLVEGNVIARTGLDPRITYGTHGIYAKVADATIRQNRISQFRNDGVSVRYRNATVASNFIADGNIGIGWFQYDSSPGTSRFLDNTIAHTSNAGDLRVRRGRALPPADRELRHLRQPAERCSRRRLEPAAHPGRVPARPKCQATVISQPPAGSSARSSSIVSASPASLSGR